MKEERSSNLPDPAAREPAEGDLDFRESGRHLRHPENEPSSQLPVESGALVDPVTEQQKPERGA